MRVVLSVKSSVPRVLLIVPAYNEEDSIARVVNSIRSSGYDYIVINDGSTDNTEMILRDIGARHVQLIHNLGIGGAVQTGFLFAQRESYDIAIQFDGDGQHDIGSIKTLVDAIVSGADIALGSRFVGGENRFMSSFSRRVGIHLLSSAVFFATGTTLHDVTSGFRACGKNAIELFAGSYPSDFPEPESLVYALSNGLRVAEVPVVMHDRMGGTSSISFSNAAWYMIKVGLSIILRGSYLHRRTNA